MQRIPAHLFTSSVFCLLLAFSVVAQQSEPDYPETPKVAPASDEGQKAVAGFTFPENLEINLFAAEPDVANPVAFHVDLQGRVFVCESFRQGKGIEDNRNHGHWLNDDLAAQTVADRIAYIRKHLGDKAEQYTRYDDRIRLLVDEDLDGRADTSRVFANRFNQIEMGTGAGVLSYRDRVYYTCIPHLWLLRDKDQDNISDVRRSLHGGYGVRFAFRGHDSHGLIVGPDGRIYFSIGDRGYNIESGGKRFKDPASGAVFRCELDGSNLEVIATGLRNPQELAFDDHGNLFTGDNNSDSGDKARWVQVLPGSDSGWRMYYQYLPDRGPFNREKIWHPYAKLETPAYIVPPVANLADGPSGLAYYPGTGLGESFRGKFFLCDFRGGPANSGIRTFRVKPKGATFEVVDMEKTFWRQLVTDVQFAPDGSLYVSDWVNGWNGLGKGRIYRYTHPTEKNSMIVTEVKKILSGGMKELSVNRLVQLLDSPDQRVRREAQFELVARKRDAALKKVAINENGPTLARIHALWGLEQLLRKQTAKAKAIHSLTSLLQSDDEEVRAQMAKLIGDCGATDFGPALSALTRDSSARVRFFATMSLGKQQFTAEWTPARAADTLFNLLNENGDEDPVLRHAGIMALANLDREEIWRAARDSESRFVQKAAVVALRKLKSPRLKSYVDGSAISSIDNEVLLEAVRAVHDLPLNQFFPQIAALANRTGYPDAVTRRALNAGYRLGTPQHAQSIAALAAKPTAAPAMRLEALDMLKSWAKPSNRDRVLGDWRPLASRPREAAATALRGNLVAILGGNTKITQAAIDAAAGLGIREIEPVIRKRFADTKGSASTRANALRAMEALNSDMLDRTAIDALNDDQELVRIAARDVLSRVDPPVALESLGGAMTSTSLAERQQAFASLGRMSPQQAGRLLEQAMRNLKQGKVPRDTRLDVVEAARKIGSQPLKRLLTEYDKAISGEQGLGGYTDCLQGGNSAAGRKIFFEKAAVYCVRCHQVAGRGGNVGPDLSRIATEKDRRYLLQAIVQPNAAIARNYETVLLATDDGLSYSGILKEESETELVLLNAEGKTVRIPKETIEQRGKGKSSMPADLINNLSKMEVRDLVDFLSSLK